MTNAFTHMENFLLLLLLLPQPTQTLAPRPKSQSWGPNPSLDAQTSAPRSNSSPKAQIRVSRPKSLPPGQNAGLEAQIPASRLKSQNPSHEAQIPAPRPNSKPPFIPWFLHCCDNDMLPNRYFYHRYYKSKKNDNVYKLHFQQNWVRSLIALKNGRRVNFEKNGNGNSLEFFFYAPQSWWLRSETRVANILT